MFSIVLQKIQEGFMINVSIHFYIFQTPLLYYV